MGFLDATGITTLVNKLKTKFQPLLVSGTNIKTVGGNSLLGSGNVPFPTVPIAWNTAPLMDGTASSGSGTTYARGNHRHPTDTSRQETLVSGTNIKTINGNSLLGSGDLTVGGSEPQVWYAVSSTAADAAVKVATVSEQGFTLKAGSLISIMLTYGHSSPSGSAILKLNINETGDKQLYTERGLVVARDYYLQIGSIITVVYDGNNYILVSNTKPVNVVPTLESGVKIGSINDINLYAPSGGGGGGNCVTLYGTNVSSGGDIYYDAEKTVSLLEHFDYDSSAYKAYLDDADSIRLIDGNKIYYPTFLNWDSGDDEWEMWIMVMSNNTLVPKRVYP